MNIKQLGMLVDYMWKRATSPVSRAYMPVMIWGQTGIGKSETVRERTSRFPDAEFIDLRLGTQETGDLIGIPRVQDVFPDPVAIERGKKSKLFTKEALVRHLSVTYPEIFRDMSLTEIWREVQSKIPEEYQGQQRMVYALPEWFPEPGTRGVLFLDELNRGDKAVLQAVFQLLLDRKLHLASLPEDWVIFAAINPADENYGQTQWDPSEDRAFLSRFCHVALQPDPKEWLSYAQASNVDPTILAFLTNQSKWLGEIGAVSLPSNIAPTPRSWVLFSRVARPLISEVYENKLVGNVTREALDKQTLLREMAIGFVGPDAYQLWNAVAMADVQPVSGDEILAGWANRYPSSTQTDEEGRPRMLEAARDRFLRVYDTILRRELERATREGTDLEEARSIAKGKAKTKVHSLVMTSSNSLVSELKKLDQVISQQAEAIKSSDPSISPNSALKRAALTTIGPLAIANLTAISAGQLESWRRTIEKIAKANGVPVSEISGKDVNLPEEVFARWMSYPLDASTDPSKTVIPGYFSDLMDWGMADELARVFREAGIGSSSGSDMKSVKDLLVRELSMQVLTWWNQQRGVSVVPPSIDISSTLGRKLGKIKKPDDPKDKMGALESEDDVLSTLLQR